MAEDLLEKKPLQTAALSGGERTAYEALKTALARELEMTRKATAALKKRGFGGAAKKQGNNKKNNKAKNAEKKQRQKKEKKEKSQG